MPRRLTRTAKRFALAACLAVAMLSVGVLLLGAQEGQGELPPAATGRIDFVNDVQPILATRCYSCHGPDKQKSGYRLDVKAIALTGGDSGGSIVPGNSAESPFIHYVAGLDEAPRMPAEGAPLTAEQVGILRAWIDQGAVWPDSADHPLEDPRNHWAFQPLSQPVPPAIGDGHAGWVRNPIDAFILAKLAEKDLAPSAPADQRTLLRRVTFDLVGLPPTPDEVARFLADDAPDAYPRRVDELLASPRYGERWARHWMDVVHFAETHGNDQDRPRPNAWPYRDYLIRSFNDDKPYARFVAEQLAGDVLFPGDPQGTVATGFIAAGPWDESSQRDIQGDTIDKTIAQNLDRDDMVTTTMATFTSTTVHCARCHNHKFDPIPQAEYYSLQAVFAGVDRANRPYEPDPALGTRRQALAKRRQDLAAGVNEVGLAALLDPAAQAEVAAWERTLSTRNGGWTTLDAATVASAEGATPTKQADGSIVFGGARPERDTYTIVAHTELQGITAVRLEVLTDANLPQQGPGRQDNGNLHLSEFKLQAAPRNDPAAAKPVVLENPSADFDQEGWTAAMAIDGKPNTAWGIHPQVGKPHLAVFEVQQPPAHEGGSTLTFTLEQKHGSGHLIGRPRLSVTTQAKPIRATPALPDAVAAALAVPAERRGDEQKAELALHLLRLQVERESALLPPPPMVYAAASDFQPEGSFKPAKGPRPVHVLRRGDVRSPLAEAAPGSLSCLPGLPARFDLANPADEGSRRAALAAWITDPRNALAWRSIVNRVWHYHFGRGIVDSPNDFGRMGSRPTHPELLDWLASWFLQQGGSLKRLHRLIVTSGAYTQSSRHDAALAQRDAGNLYLWRMNRSRLDAESLRDAVLAITGRLDPTMGGPSVKQFVESPGIHVTPMVDYLGFDVDSPAGRRRSVYRFLFRTLPDPFMDSMDCADASQLTPARNTSVTALQALAMLNNPFMVRQSEHFAERVSQASGALGGQIEAAYQGALGRPPTPKESAALISYAGKHGLANACRLILNSNEFMFVH
ncbi:MAG TPA: PSD1 and planctomycete cytochrome C domain-containing protein [Pirellulales bacterium]|nr:PSD1 and planctomycete cytochrome C domain-containing protein [Pirellulales bacterium]